MKKSLLLSLSVLLMASTSFAAPIDLKKATELNDHFQSGFSSGRDFNLLGNQQLIGGISFTGGTLSITGVGKTISSGPVKSNPYVDLFTVGNGGNLLLSGKGTGPRPGMLTLSHVKGVNGAAIYIKNGGKANLENVIIKGNTDKKNGAGLYLENTTVTGNSVVFDSNILKPDTHANVFDVATSDDGGSVTGAAIMHNFTANSSVNIGGNVDFKNNQALAGNGQNNTIKTDGVSNAPKSGQGGDILGGVVRIVNSNTSRATYTLGDATSKVSFSGNKSIAGKGGDLNFEVKDVELDTNDLTAGRGGAIAGGVINARNADFNFGKDLFFERNTITSGNGGNANLKTETFGSVTAGKGGSIEGGLLFLVNSKLNQATNNSNLVLKGNTITSGNGGAVSDMKNAIVTNTSGDGGLVSGGLIEAYNSELKIKWLTAEGNTINTGSSGTAPKVPTKFPTKDVIGGAAGNVYGGLIGLNNASILQVGEELVFRSNKVNIGTAASVKNMYKASVNAFKGIQGGLLYAEDSTLNVKYRTILDKNTITMKAMGAATATMGDSIGGDGGLASGSLMFFKNSSLLANSNFNITGNKVTLAAGGNATSSKFGDAKAGRATIAEGLVSFIGNSSASILAVSATGNTITGAKGGNAVASAMNTSTGGKGSDIYGGVFAVRDSLFNVGGNFVVDGNTFTAGAGGTASKVGGTGGAGGSALGGALSVVNSKAKLTGEKIIITNNKIISGKGGTGGIKGEDGLALGAAIYVEGDGVGKVTFGDGMKDQYIFVSGNTANGKANSFFLNSGTEMEFNLTNKSLADIRDPIRGNSTSKITQKGMGTLLAWGDNSSFYGSLTVEGGVFGLRNTAKEMGVWGAIAETGGKWLVSSGDITVKNGGYLSVQLDPKRGASQIRANKFIFETGSKILPVGVFLQNKGIRYTYNNVFIQNGTSAAFNLPASLTNYADANNVTISIPTGSGSTSSNIAYRMEVTRKKDFAEAFGISDLTIDKYIKTLDINTMAMFDKAFIEGSAADANKLITAYNAMKTDKKKKILNQVTVARTGVNQIDGFIKAYAVGSGAIPPLSLNSHSISNNKTGNRMWLSSGKNNLSEAGYSNDVDYVTFGFDKRLNKKILFGVAMQTYDGSINKGISSVDNVLMTGGSMALYGTYKNGNEYASFNTVYDFAKTNQADDNGLIASKGVYDTRAYKFGLELGHEFKVAENAILTPYTGFDYTNFSRSSYKEKAANGRSFNSMDWDNIETPIGLRITSPFMFNEKAIGKTYFDIGYVRNFGDVSASTIASVSGNGHSYSWKMRTEEIGRDTIRFKTGFDLSPTKSTNINFGYKFEGKDNYTNQVLSTDFKYSF